MDVQFLRFGALVQFNGFQYAGFQRQSNGTAVQNILEEVLSKINNRHTVVISSGRTDAGVHVWEMPISFLGRDDLSAEKWQRVLNAALPPDIRVLQVVQTEPDFNPQKSAFAKLYIYVASFGKPSPFFCQMTARFERPLQRFQEMQSAANLLVGTHDFAGFSKRGSTVKTTRRTIYDVRLNLTDDKAIFAFLGNGFLYGQVRLMVGTLLEVGWGKKEPDHVRLVLDGKGKAQYLAPACGLHLAKVWLDPNPFIGSQSL